MSEQATEATSSEGSEGGGGGFWHEAGEALHLGQAKRLVPTLLSAFGAGTQPLGDFLPWLIPGASDMMQTAFPVANMAAPSAAAPTMTEVAATEGADLLAMDSFIANPAAERAAEMAALAQESELVSTAFPVSAQTSQLLKEAEVASTLNQGTAALTGAEAAGGGFLSTLMKGAPLLAGVFGGLQAGSAISNLISGEGRVLDNSLDAAAGLSAAAWGGAAGIGLLGSGAGALAPLAALAGPLAPISAAVGLAAFGDHKTREWVDNSDQDSWAREYLTDDETGEAQSLYENVGEWSGDAYEGTHDYFADSWMGEDVGGAVGTVLGGGAGLVTGAVTGTLATAANIGAGVYGAGEAAVGAVGGAVGGAYDWLSSW